MTVSCWCSTERIDASRSPPGRPKAILTVFVSAYPDGVPHPLHIHHDAIESFFIIEGAARFYVGGVVVDAEQGAFVSVPRGAVHGFVPTAAGTRALVMFTPAAMEGFWEEVERASSNGTLDEEYLQTLSQRHHVELLGPLPRRCSARTLGVRTTAGVADPSLTRI
jgi:quercetin dioxygenase-like cupin family protein